MPAIAARIEPFELVLSRDEVIPDIARPVVVAEVPVAVVKVKFCRVDEPREKRLPKVPRPEL